MLQFDWKKLGPYQIAVALSGLSVVFGILREFLIVWLLGFSSTNDELQIYLSIFFSIALSIDAVKLSCLNLCTLISLRQIMLSAMIVSAPFTIFIGMLFSYLTGHLNVELLWIAIGGSFLNLLAAILITYKQRFGAFLSAQLINVLPNLILLPGVLLLYLLPKVNPVFYITVFCCLIPIAQLILLMFVHVQKPNLIETQEISLSKSITIFLRHGTAMIGEQIFQLVSRAAFFKLGAGYLSVLAISVRIYAAARFVLIDSYIGSKLSVWEKEKNGWNNFFSWNQTWQNLLVLGLSIFTVCFASKSLICYSLQVIGMLVFSFWFNTLVRVIYYRVNHHEHDSKLVIKYGVYEFLFAICGYFFVYQFNLSILLFMWMWFVLKPFAQLMFLKSKVYKLREVTMRGMTQ